MLKEGDVAPPFQLRAAAGREISLKDLRGQTCGAVFLPQDQHARVHDWKR